LRKAKRDEKQQQTSTGKTMKTLKKAILTALSVAFLASPILADIEPEEQTNAEYCEEIYWEDEYNCQPERPDPITKEFCLKLNGIDEIEACLELIKPNVQNTAEDAEIDNQAR
jgi:hypothetical protein